MNASFVLIQIQMYDEGQGTKHEMATYLPNE